MSKISINLSIEQPQCRYCSRYWIPEEGVSADQSYCPLCTAARKAAAAEALGLRPLSATDASYGYFLPRALRLR